MERLNREIKRRTDSVRVFPSADSLVRLVGAVYLDRDDAWLAARNFIDARSLQGDVAAAPAPEPSEEDLASVLLAVGEAFDSKRRAA